MDLGGAGRDHDLLRVDVEHERRRPHDDQRPRIDPDDLIALLGIEDEHPLAGLLGRRGGLLAAVATADHGDIDMGPQDLDVGAGQGRREVGAGNLGQRRQPVRRVADDGETRSGLQLARPDVGDALDPRQAVAAIAGQAQRPWAGGCRAAAQDRDRDRVTGGEGHGATVDDDTSRLGDPRRTAAVGHWRILAPAGSNNGSGWSRAGLRRPMISISKPSPPAPSGVASSVGT